TTSFLQAGHARHLLEWDARVAAGDRLYVSLDPSQPGACALDFEAVHPDSLPDAWQAVAGLFPGVAAPRYLKCRPPPGTGDRGWGISRPGWPRGPTRRDGRGVSG